MSPVKKKPGEAVDKWAAGIGKAKDEKAFSKGVTAAGAESFAKGVEQAGDTTWASGVAKAAEGERWSTKAIKAATEWEANASKAEKKWAANTLAAKADFETQITKVIDAVGGCLDEITPGVIKNMMNKLNAELPEKEKLTAKQVKALLFQNCMADQKAKGKFD